MMTHDNYFSSGPCRKNPNWNSKIFDNPVIGRSHRSVLGKELLAEVIRLHKKILQIPEDYLLGIIPGSATGAIECALWNLLGTSPVTCFVYDFFGQLWAKDIEQQLKLKNFNKIVVDYGCLPDFTNNYNDDHDLVFNWCGTTSGVMLTDLNWVNNNHKGLVICDATSAVFCTPLPWEKLDAVAFSWQKGLGGEAAHGMLALSPKAVERLNHYTPTWPIPRLLNLKTDQDLNLAIFQGLTINTPSMLAVVDVLNALQWVENNSGVDFCQQQCLNNFHVVNDWLKHQPNLKLMAKEARYVAPHVVCLEVLPWSDLPLTQHRQNLQQIAKILADKNIAFDILNHMQAPPSLRIWCGPTISTASIKNLLSELDLALHNLL